MLKGLLINVKFNLLFYIIGATSNLTTMQHFGVNVLSLIFSIQFYPLQCAIRSGLTIKGTTVPPNFKRPESKGSNFKSQPQAQSG